METVVGDVVIIPFPFSDLSQNKRRPAYVVASFEEEVILCQITGSCKELSVEISPKDFEKGSLPISLSFLRPHKLFTADKKIILKKAGILKRDKKEEIQSIIRKIFDN